MKPLEEHLGEDPDAIHGYAVVDIDPKTGKRHFVGSTASGVRTLEHARQTRVKV